MRGNRPSVPVCLSLLAAGALLAACGQRGALYLPEESRNVVVTPAQPAASPAPAATPATPAPADTEPTEAQRRNNATTPAK